MKTTFPILEKIQAGFLVLMFVVFLTACGGGGGGENKTEVESVSDAFDDKPRKDLIFDDSGVIMRNLNSDEIESVTIATQYLETSKEIDPDVRQNELLSISGVVDAQCSWSDCLYTLTSGYSESYQYYW